MTTAQPNPLSSRVRKIKQYTEEVDIELDEDALHDRRIDLTALLDHIDEETEKFADIRTRHRAKLTQLKADVKKIRIEIETKLETREVVIEEWLTSSNEIVKVDQADGEIVGEARTATPDELQESLPLTNPKQPDPPLAPPAPVDPQDLPSDDDAFGGVH